MNEPQFSVFSEGAAKERKPAAPGKGPVNEETLRKANEILSKYASAKAADDRRVAADRRYFRQRFLDARDPEGPCVSAWLLNAVMNKHADFMDAVPECTVLPREESDERAAEALSAVLPVILERGGWPSVYSDGVYDKLGTGAAVWAVLWDPDAAGGLGDVAVKAADTLRLFWEPGVKDVQKSRNFFSVEYVDNDVLLERYPTLEGKLGPGGRLTSYLFDESVDVSDKTPVIDWYYKKTVGGRTVLHFVKYVGETPLYASENDPVFKERGWYDHARYPFVFDPLFAREGAPTGFGLLDILKDAQKEIDVLDNELVRSARIGARRRYFTRSEGAINEEEFADLRRDFVHVSGSSLGEDSIREIPSSPLPPVYLSVLSHKITELKETGGNRDFTAGGTAGGVTSGTAIAALQEAGSKLSRDMIAATYRAFSEVCSLAIELVRQFYDVPRAMRVLGKDGAWDYRVFGSADLLPREDGRDLGLGLSPGAPVFDVTVKAHKSDAFSRAARNADAVNFFSMGFFDPARAPQALACLEMLEVEDKARLLRVIEENGRRYGYLPAAPGGAPFASDPGVDAVLRDRLAASKRGDAAP